MIRTLPLLRAVGCSALATATLMAPAWSAGATAPPPPPTVPPTGNPVSPAPTNRLVVDDTLTISVAIPSTWTDVSTAPGVDAAGNSFPQIAAAPNLASFESSFDTPGLFYAVQPFTADTAAGVAGMDFSQACTDGGTIAYVDGYFTGHMKTWTNCGGGQGQLVALFVNPADQRFSAVLQVGLATPADRPALDLALASFFVGKPQVGTGAPPPGGNTAVPTPSTVVGPPPVVPIVPTTTGVGTGMPTVPTLPTVPTSRPPDRLPRGWWSRTTPNRSACGSRPRGPASAPPRQPGREGRCRRSSLHPT